MNRSEILFNSIKEILRAGKSARIQAKGWSMHPFIRNGDTITVSPVKNSSVKTGDVVLYSTAGNKFVVHRIIQKYKKENKMIRLAKGDASLGPPEKVDVQNILGKVVSVERKGRWINLNKGRMKFISLVYAWLWPLIIIPKTLGRILSLFNPDLFVKTPEASFRSLAEKYDGEEEVDFHTKIVSEGLEEWEELAVKFMKAKAKILDVGCGAGREAIALTKIGFEVTGIDISPTMIAQAIKNAKKEGLNMSFKVQNAADIDYPAKSFDYVLFSRGVYSYVPTNKLRVRILKKIRDILKPDGMLFFTVYYKDKRLFSRLNIMGFFRRLRNVFFKGKYESEPGDLMVRYVSSASTPERLCFCHFFSSPDEVSQEVRAAGMTVVEVRNNSIWIVKP